MVLRERLCRGVSFAVLTGDVHSVITVAVAPFVLLSGSERIPLTPVAGRELLKITHAMLEMLFLPQFQPLLLPKYAVELTAVLVFGETCERFDTGTQVAFRRLRETTLHALPLRLSMTSLRAALGQTSTDKDASVVATLQPFKQLCGQLLSQLLMEEGGVTTTIEMLLSGVDEGNTQARMQVATLVRVDRSHRQLWIEEGEEGWCSHTLSRCRDRTDLPVSKRRRSIRLRTRTQPPSEAVAVACVPEQQAVV